MQNIIAVVGPTASGKTGLSINLAKHFNGEIVSADSMQIYHEMNIGTAKPSLDERQGIMHHLMGHLSVEETYNVATYVRDAQKILKDLEQRGTLPILCGGTGLYIDHLLNDTEFFEIPLDLAVRERYQRLALEKGNGAIFELLKERDPALAENLHPNDSKRIIRGLEVLDITGRRLSDFQQESRRESPYRVLYIGLNYKDRALLYERINRRVDLMIADGLLDEVRSLMKDYNLSDTARAAIGYKELIDSFASGSDLDAAVELIKQKSRNYAKRQLTWFHRNSEIHWLYGDEMSSEELLENAVRLMEEFLKGGKA